MPTPWFVSHETIFLNFMSCRFIQIKCKMYNSNEFSGRAFYSVELKHQICKEHIEIHLPDFMKQVRMNLGF